MAHNVTSTEVRNVGNWSTTDFGTSFLYSAPFITAGDSWLNKILSNNGYASLTAYTTASADGGALAKAAQCYYVAALIVSIPAKEDFQAGNVKSTEVRNTERKEMAAWYIARAKDMLDKAGMKYETWSWSYTGGDDYHPDENDNTNIDFGATDESRAFQVFGVDDE
ncbi:MAG: hypothetical protein PHX83_12075 [Acidobacteriia bacterium]|nr:hypothetical protein [Terriglobia bacterium]